MNADSFSLETLLPQTTSTGSVFVTNYPPYTSWEQANKNLLTKMLHETTAPKEKPIGMYVHIPFCRNRCKFCWYKVYTGKEYTSRVKAYNQALLDELDMYRASNYVSDRSLEYIHFGGGTPSLLATKHLEKLLLGMQNRMSWSAVREVTFECEPGTLSKQKLQLLKDLGVTRISIGFESLNNDILKHNDRIHSVADCLRAFAWTQEIGFDHVSVDLLAGLPGENENSWKQTVETTVKLGPDAVSIYQLELPTNTLFANELFNGKKVTFADWEQKRDWTKHAFLAFLGAGYVVTDSRSLIKANKRMSTSPSLYQDGINTGKDFLSLGASPFGYLGDYQYQNEKIFKHYLGTIEDGELPIHRVCVMSKQDRFIKEFILQLKTGMVDAADFIQKFDLNPKHEFVNQLSSLEKQGLLVISGSSIDLSLFGLLTVDFWLPVFYKENLKN